MHSHDLDTIAALADGSLELERHDAARRLLDHCNECREEFEAQLLVLEVLSEAAPATLTELERARLHQAVAQLDPQPAQRRGWLTWMPRVAVAAVAVAFVGTFGVLFFGNADTSDSAQDLGAAAVTEAPAEETADAATALQAEEAPAAAAEESAADDAGAVRATPVTIYGELGELRDLDSLTRETFSLAVPETMALTDDQQLEFSCLADARLLGGIAIAAKATLDGDPVEVFEVDEEFFMVLAPDDCAEVAFPGTGSN